MDQESRADAAIKGALVADAASLGFHWLYDQETIKQYGGDKPEFHAPNRVEYGDKGYFAHDGKESGEFSHYGAQLLVMKEAIDLAGHYEEKIYIESFRRWFDFGGQWVGYIDHPTRGTLLNIYDRLASEASLNACGADDTQNPAVSKLPPLLAQHYGNQTLDQLVESAVRVTNNNDMAVQFALASARMIKAAIGTKTPADCVQAARGIPDVDACIEKAESMIKQSSQEVAQEVGMHCNLDASFTVITHLLLNAQNYEQAIRENILCGGDNCGRSITLGAVLAACFHDSDKGVPDNWMSRTTYFTSRV
ncbi:ADP-ribosylglycohydrolase family protein [Endozoicomonas ascidiicola]|uniref:ADP-ribosylglycohydrolase family protein n=1 Tax=Endozoicomonas ascidiicola TaxID=1698521 RepID=UPI00082957C5|nr:ADP-ribosylglycohydrolase family protein [Endozoicomonas ascidiicola]